MKSALQYKERIEPLPERAGGRCRPDLLLEQIIVLAGFVASPALRAFVAPKWVAAAGRTPDAISSNPCRRHQGIDLGKKSGADAILTEYPNASPPRELRENLAR
jgi:hypothetical protein